MMGSARGSSHYQNDIKDLSEEEEKELNEFCETSSWETNSALSDTDMERAEGEHHRGAKSHGVYSREESDSQESVSSDKLL